MCAYRRIMEIHGVLYEKLTKSSIHVLRHTFDMTTSRIIFRNNYIIDSKYVIQLFVCFFTFEQKHKEFYNVQPQLQQNTDIFPIIYSIQSNLMREKQQVLRPTHVLMIY